MNIFNNFQNAVAPRTANNNEKTSPATQLSHKTTNWRSGCVNYMTSYQQLYDQVYDSNSDSDSDD